jgi:hypothetical protein
MLGWGLTSQGNHDTHIPLFWVEMLKGRIEALSCQQFVNDFSSYNSTAVVQRPLQVRSICFLSELLEFTPTALESRARRPISVIVVSFRIH